MAKQITENFTLEEMFRSATAERRGIDNRPPKDIEENLTYLVKNVLQPLRNYVGVPIRVTSGYRSPALNRAVGGSPSSWHSHGCAADIQIPSGKVSLKHVFEYIYHNLPYTELIAEGIDGNGRVSWVHVALVKGREAKNNLDPAGRLCTKYMMNSNGAVYRASFDKIKGMMKI
jgi:Uncharacterized protein conserved in bacteria